MRAMALTAAVFGMTLGSLAAAAAPAVPVSLQHGSAPAITRAADVDSAAPPLVLVDDRRHGRRHHGHRHWHRGGPPRHYYRPAPRAYYAPPPRAYYAPPRAYYAPPPRAYYAPPPGVSLNFRF